MDKLGRERRQGMLKGALMVTLQSMDIQDQINQGIAAGNKGQTALNWMVNAPGSGQTVDTLDSGSLLIDGSVWLGATVKPSAQESAGFNDQFAGGVTDGTLKAADM